MNADENGNPKIFKRSDGSSGSSFEVRADSVEFLSSKGEPAANDEVPF